MCLNRRINKKKNIENINNKQVLWTQNKTEILAKTKA